MPADDNLIAHLIQLPRDLLSSPDQVPNPPVESRPALLPFGELTWENFERLCCRLAERVDHSVRTRLWGRPGEKQDGIDVVGFRQDQSVFVYQVRRVEQVTARMIKQATADFADGQLPFSPDRFVLCTARSARSTRVQAALEACRKEYDRFEIDIYDEEYLSSILRLHSDIVDDFFGEVWADSFCGSHRLPHRLQRQPKPKATWSADALLRGPLRALGLESFLDEAEGTPDVHRASVIYDAIAATLVDNSYDLHAKVVQERRADSLERMGLIEESYNTWLGIVLNDLHDGRANLTPSCIRKLDEHSIHVGATMVARYLAIKAFDSWYEAPESGRSVLLKALESMSEHHDPWAVEFCALAGEAALVDDRIDDLQACLEQVTTLMPVTDELEVTRFQLVSAESRAEWTDLLRAAGTGRITPQAAGLVYARYARSLVFSGHTGDAIDHYRRSIEKYAQTELFGEIAEAFYSIAWLHAVSDMVRDSDFLEAHRLASTLDSDGYGRSRYLVKGRWNARSSALASMQAENWPDAHHALRRYLWEARTSGHVRDEFEARRLLGDLYANTQEPMAALVNYVTAGEATKAAALAAVIDEVVDVSQMLESNVPTILLAALKVTKEQADRLPQDYLDRVLESVRLSTRWTGPRSRVIQGAAWDALGELGFALSQSAVEPLIREIESAFSPGVTRNRLAEDGMLTLLSRIYWAWPVLREDAGSLFLDAAADSDVAYRAKGFLVHLATIDTSARSRLMAMVDKGHVIALEILASAGIYHPLAAERVLNLRNRVNRYVSGEGRHEVSIPTGLEELAILCGSIPDWPCDQLANDLMLIACDVHASEMLRASAVHALGDLSPHISDELGQELWPKIGALVSPAIPVAAIDVMARESIHPLSRYKINLGFGGLRIASIRALGLLASSEDQAQICVEMAMLIIASGEENLMPIASNMLEYVCKQHQRQIDLRPFAIHWSSAVRRASASIWSLNPLQAPELGLAFMADPATEVRVELAEALDEIAHHSHELESVIRTQLLSDRSAAVRTFASTAGD